MRNLILLLILLSVYSLSKAQSSFEQRLIEIEQKLNMLSEINIGLQQKLETVVSDIPLGQFLTGIAATHNLNIQVAPDLNQTISVYFSNEKVSNVLLHLAKQFRLDFSFTGSIISVRSFRDPQLDIPPLPRQIDIFYDPVTQNITMDLYEDTLLHIARKITQLSNKNVVVTPPIFFKRITGYTQELSVESALEKLAIINGFKLTKTNDDVYVLEPLQPNEEIIAKPTNSQNANYTIKRIRQDASGNTSPHSIQVEEDDNKGNTVTINVSNIPIRDLIRDIAEQTRINYFIYSEIAGNTTANVQNMPVEDVFSYILQGTKYTFSIDRGVYMIGDRNDEGLRKHRLIHLQHRSVDSLLDVIPQQIKQNVDIKEFKELNSFLLSGSEPEIREIEAFVKQLDRTVPMVMIEVILMDVKKSKTVETGISMGVSDSVTAGGTLLSGIDYTFGAGDVNRFIDRIGLNNVFNLGRVTPNFYLSLKALEGNANIDLRQTPKLSTLNGHSANLSIGNTRYYAVSTQNVVGSLNPNTIVTQQFFPVEANLAINIRPFVSGEEQITLNIDINITDFVGNTTITAPPPSATSKFKSIIRVKNEEMIALGGIERNERSDEGSGIPILSRIPVIKWFFSSRKKVTSKTVSIVFIKPSIFY